LLALPDSECQEGALVGTAHFIRVAGAACAASTYARLLLFRGLKGGEHAR
jgi:hypothetical protein